MQIKMVFYRHFRISLFIKLLSRGEQKTSMGEQKPYQGVNTQPYRVYQGLNTSPYQGTTRTAYQGVNKQPYQGTT